MTEISGCKIPFLPATPLINVDFRNLSYAVSLKNKEEKLILKNISGQFRSGELTAILGPSGSGKTTLLNILAGYKYQQTSGTILINGKLRKETKFTKISRYIMQENCIHPLLSVQETMMIAAGLKLGRKFKKEDKLKIVMENLDLLRLSSAKNTYTDKLSGGELKRLFIALELISNPSVLFLDEPTSGLDEVSSYLCVSLLQQLAETGRTVICSIHAPSARLFSCFHSSYFVASGQCVYQGCGSDLVPYLAQLETPCPVQYNPADYIIELCSGDYKDLEQKMVLVMQNGQNLYQNESFICIGATSSRHLELTEERSENLKVATWDQFQFLLLRMFLLQWRNKKYLLLKASTTLVLGTLTGIIYQNLAQDPTITRFNVVFYVNYIILFALIPMLPLLLQVPTEIKYLKREHFNQWYNIKSFFLALTISTIPDQITFSVFYLTPLFLLTSQPFEFNRILGFYGVAVLITAISEGYAVIIGSSMNVTNSSFFGVYLMVPFVFLTVHGLGENYDNVSLTFKIMMHSSFLRYAFEAITVIMLSGRKLECPEHVNFCMYADQDFYLKSMSLDHIVVWVDILVLVIFVVLLKFIGYYFLRQRLNPNKVFKFVKSHIKIKV